MEGETILIGKAKSLCPENQETKARPLKLASGSLASPRLCALARLCVSGEGLLLGGRSPLCSFQTQFLNRMEFRGNAGEPQKTGVMIL